MVKTPCNILQIVSKDVFILQFFLTVVTTNPIIYTTTIRTHVSQDFYFSVFIQLLTISGYEASEKKKKHLTSRSRYIGLH